MQRVVVDDHIALLAALDVLWLPDWVELPLLTTYGFQQRIAAAIITKRLTTGFLRAIYDAHTDPEARWLGAGVLENSDTLRYLDPTRHVIDTTHYKIDLHLPVLAAELLAAAVTQGAIIRVTPANAAGNIATVLQQSPNTGVWDLNEHDGRYEIVDTNIRQ
ncbi:MAG TPA: hypothetical protein VHD87_14850 [Acidimicrobiales bacterium]|nr:hypothetical protein [Acidimicrobiales bacterium]